VSQFCRSIKEIGIILANSRSKKILKLIDNKSLLGLEIGPSYNPIAPKREGWNIQIVDHLSSEELKEKYQAWGVKIDLIEHVDYILGSEGLYAAISKNNYYDYVIASHVIEHTPDLIQFLIDCQNLLKSNGILSLVVPDKRFCFDAMKPLTTTGQVLQAHIEKRKRHSPGVIYDAYSLHANKSGSIVWPGNMDQSDLTFAHSVIEAKALMDEYILHDKYVDVHAWYFEYASFKKLLLDIIEMKFIDMKIDFESGSDGYEFYFSLRKNN
jgi:SAM-dependent methyltransferase